MSAAAVVVVGADRAPHGMDALGERLGRPVEWVEGSVRRCEQVERRVRAGTVAGIIVLDGYMSHRTFAPLLAACRVAGTPFGYAGRRGKSALAAAGETIAGALASRRVA